MAINLPTGAMLCNRFVEKYVYSGDIYHYLRIQQSDILRITELDIYLIHTFSDGQSAYIGN